VQLSANRRRDSTAIQASSRPLQCRSEPNGASTNATFVTFVTASRPESGRHRFPSYYLVSQFAASEYERGLPTRYSAGAMTMLTLHKRTCGITLTVLLICGYASVAPGASNGKPGPPQTNTELSRKAQDALAKQEFERILSIFDQQCTFKNAAETLDAQVNCTVSKYRDGTSPATAPLPLKVCACSMAYITVSSAIRAPTNLSRRTTHA
jgi:hypothetical protein